MMEDELLLLIISSPSGAGKTTLTRDLLERFSELTFSVSHTTRAPRQGEVDGRDYHFTERPAFEALVAEGRFAEWAEVHGNLYGTARSEVERCRAEGKRGIVFDIDYQGARQIKAAWESAVGIFVLPPSMPELRARLQRRASDDEATIDRRYNNARREIENYGLFDYVIVNDDLALAKEQMASVVHSERIKRPRMAARAEQLLRAGRLAGRE